MKRLFLKYRTLFRWIIAAGVFGILIVASCNLWIIQSTKGQVFDSVSLVPARNSALLLGTSPLNRFGQPNRFFVNRIHAAAELFRSGKIKKIIVSGDNGTMEYNEPEEMKKALIKLGVPEEAISLDYAGFRTLDSVIRCRNVFGETEIIIISQEFHNQRALFIANSEGFNAVALNAGEVDVNYSVRTRVREIFAKTLAVFDVLTGTEPRFVK